MRIISGRYKSRILKDPGSSGDIRPTTDRARETLFNMLNNIFDFDGLNCLDLFCGTGSFGLECISRGAAYCTFVDKDIRLVLENIKLLKVESCDAVKEDGLFFTKAGNLKGQVDIAFADPPYGYKDYDKLIAAAKEQELYFILEHSEKQAMPEEFRQDIAAEKKIGISAFTFYDFNNSDE